MAPKKGKTSKKPAVYTDYGAVNSETKNRFLVIRNMLFLRKYYEFIGGPRNTFCSVQALRQATKEATDIVVQDILVDIPMDSSLTYTAMREIWKYHLKDVTNNNEK